MAYVVDWALEAWESPAADVSEVPVDVVSGHAQQQAVRFVELREDCPAGR